MPQKSNNELGAGGLSEAGMKINYHDGKDELEEILKSVQHAGAADLTRQFLEFTNILRREDQVSLAEICCIGSHQIGGYLRQRSGATKW